MEKQIQVCILSGSNLAYIGDAVFELLVRERVLSGGSNSQKYLNNEVKKYVNATAQAKMYFYVYDILTEEEQNILKRGKNAKIKTVPKNCSIMEYKMATGLEALFGYLYLRNDKVRLYEIFNKCIIFEGR